MDIEVFFKSILPYNKCIFKTFVGSNNRALLTFRDQSVVLMFKQLNYTLKIRFPLDNFYNGTCRQQNC